MNNKTKLNHLKMKLNISKDDAIFEIPIINYVDSYYKIEELFFEYNEQLLKQVSKFNLLIKNHSDFHTTKVLIYCELFHTTIVDERLQEFLDNYKYEDIKDLYKPILNFNSIINIVDNFFILTKQEKLNIIRNTNNLQNQIMWGLDCQNIPKYLNKIYNKIILDKNICDLIFSYLILELINPYYYLSKDINFMILVNQLLNKVKINPTFIFCFKESLNEFEINYLNSWSVFYEDGNLTNIMITLFKILNDSIIDANNNYSFKFK